MQTLQFGGNPVIPQQYGGVIGGYYPYQTDWTQMFGMMMPMLMMVMFTGIMIPVMKGLTAESLHSSGEEKLLPQTKLERREYTPRIGPGYDVSVIATSREEAEKYIKRLPFEAIKDIIGRKRDLVYEELEKAGWKRAPLPKRIAEGIITWPGWIISKLMGDWRLETFKHPDLPECHIAVESSDGYIDKVYVRAAVEK